jgi:hypothetical protein
MEEERAALSEGGGQGAHAPRDEPGATGTVRPDGAGTVTVLPEGEDQHQSGLPDALEEEPLEPDGETGGGEEEDPSLPPDALRMAMPPLVPLDESVLGATADPRCPFFHVALGGGQPFDECFQPYLGGTFKGPIPVYYKSFYRAGELELAVHGHSSFGAPFLPVHVQAALAQAGVTDFDFFW